MADDPLNAPVMNPPPGEVQDLDNPPNKNDVVIAVYTVCLIIVSTFVALRLYSKFVLLKMARTQDLQNGFYGFMLYSVVMATIKPFILLEWIHLFASGNRRKTFKWTCYTLGAVNVLMYTISILIDATCLPPA
ncbi:hypothetical protein PG994_006870 [Apiospora phragmitis]|uniref:Uncharacterized protein n=1 Tax=Apiospora phragmitis TaxID=2905665 RepID=A0ABR1VGA9_9PEZI